jgi:glucose 1-dehydrogenase
MRECGRIVGPGDVEELERLIAEGFEQPVPAGVPGADLPGKVALVTGASRGIGRGCAIELARAGARVTVNYDSHEDEARDTAAEIERLGSEAMIYGASVADRPAVDAMVAATVERFGRLDIVVANAARSVRRPFLELTPQDVADTWAVSLWGVFHAAQAGARVIARQGEGGKIVVISSVLSFIPFANSLPYNTAKAGINQMAYTMAAELTGHRINVNVIEPGWTDTPGERAFLSEAELQAAAGELPWGRLATIEDVGRACAFLCSSAADYITGACLRVDGGYWLPRKPAPVNREAPD